MKVPSRRVLEDDALQEHILTIDQRHHNRTQETLDTVPLLVSRSLGHVHVGTLLSIGVCLIGHPVAFLRLHATRTFKHLFPLTLSHLALLDRTPELAIAVNHALTSDGDILGTIGRERRLTTTRIKSLERGLDNRIERLVARELDDGTHLQMEVDVGLEHDGTCEPHASRHHQMTTALLCQGRNSLLESFGIQSGAIAYSAELLQVHRVGRNNGSADLRHLKRQFLRVLLVGILCLSRHSYGQQQHTN